MTGTGIVIACLTLRLNPQVHARPGDALRLMAILAVAYALAGFVMGAAAGGCLALGFAAAGRRVSASRRRWLEGAALGLVGFGPLLYAALLPDVGLTDNALTWLIFSTGQLRKVAVLLAVALALGAAGVLVRPIVRALRRRVGLTVGQSAAIGVSRVALRFRVGMAGCSREQSDLSNLR